MAYRLPAIDDTPFDMQIKNLPDEELLDFWEETQQIELMLNEQYKQGVTPVMDYERLIVLELQRRSCHKHCE